MFSSFHLEKQSVWIGIADVITDGRWITYPDTMYPTYLNWDSREPNGKTAENCVEMAKGYGYKWNDISCSHVRKFICEKAR
ncbi:hypothetical protein FSP39_007198 [Pinctada imbricata]|uniref:C-type lectin domain-containing protein n=1 Tax=Pinctada imbricata TaxID=66713 RepID=A0AA88YQ21_PINIB|nr:hypothetical protein FSP39_007198 [Pinctada imbricata]